MRFDGAIKQCGLFDEPSSWGSIRWVVGYRVAHMCRSHQGIGAPGWTDLSSAMLRMEKICKAVKGFF